MAVPSRSAVYVTLNTEYHVLAARCVRVKDRNSGAWLREHRALQQRLCGGLRFTPDGASQWGTSGARAQVGESLLFRGDGCDLVTSAVIEVHLASAA